MMTTFEILAVLMVTVIAERNRMLKILMSSLLLVMSMIVIRR